MSTTVAGEHTNGTMENEDTDKRDVKNHLVFEVSTEAANRGIFCSFVLSRCSG